VFVSELSSSWHQLHHSALDLAAGDVGDFSPGVGITEASGLAIEPSGPGAEIGPSFDGPLADDLMLRRHNRP
jgi:hypothetical protein